MASMPRLNRPSRGIAFRISAAICFALMSALLKIGASRGAGVVELILYRSAVGVPVVLAWVAIGPGLSTLIPNRIGAHVWRSAIGICSMFATFGALILLPLAEATTLLFTGPVFATLMSWMLLGERVGRHRMMAGLAAFTGVIVVMRPGTSAESVAPLGVAVGLAAAFGQASVTVTLRHLGSREHVGAIVFWFLSACTLTGLILLPFFGRGPDPGTIAILCAGGVFGGLAQILMTASLQEAPISILAPFDYLQLVTAMLLGWLLLGTEPSINTYAGALLIAGSGLYTLRRERRLRREAPVPATQPVAS